MASLDPNLSSSTTNRVPDVNADISGVSNLTARTQLRSDIPTPVNTAPTEPLPLQVNARPVAAEPSSGMGRWFKYYFGPLFGVLNEQELRTVSQVKSGMRNLERALKGGSQSLPKNGSLTQMKVALDFAETQIEALSNPAISQGTAHLARDFHRYSDLPEQIEKLRAKTVHLRHQYEFGVKLSEYSQAVRNYSDAVDRLGVPRSWNEFQKARSEMQGMAAYLINKIENDPTLNQKRSIRSMIRNVRTNDSKGSALLKLASHSYPQYEKFLRSLFNKTVQLSRGRFSNLRDQKEYLKPLIERYNTQVKEIARLEAIINDTSAMGRVANVAYNYIVGDRKDQLNAAKEALQETLQSINLNRFATHEEVLWLRNIAETSSEARTIFDSIASTMGKIYQINASDSEEHSAARASIAADLDVLIAELKQRTPNQGHLNEGLEAIVDKIGNVHANYRTECVLPRNFEKLNDFQKLEALIKVHLPGLETKTAEIASLAKKKRLTQAINRMVSESIAEYNRARTPVVKTKAAPPLTDQNMTQDVLHNLIQIDHGLVDEDYSEDSIGEEEDSMPLATVPAANNINVDKVQDSATPVVQGRQNTIVEPTQVTTEEIPTPENQFNDLGNIIPLAPTLPPPPPPPPPSLPQQAFKDAPSLILASQLSGVSLKKADNRPASTAVPPPVKDPCLVDMFGNALRGARINEEPELSSIDSGDDDEWSMHDEEDQTTNTEGTQSTEGAAEPTAEVTQPTEGSIPPSESPVPSVSRASIMDGAPPIEDEEAKAARREQEKARREQEQEELRLRQTAMINLAAASLHTRRGAMRGDNKQKEEW